MFLQFSTFPTSWASFISFIFSCLRDDIYKSHMFIIVWVYMLQKVTALKTIEITKWCIWWRIFIEFHLFKHLFGKMLICTCKKTWWFIMLQWCQLQKSCLIVPNIIYIRLVNITLSQKNIGGCKSHVIIEFLIFNTFQLNWKMSITYILTHYWSKWNSEIIVFKPLNNNKGFKTPIFVYPCCIP
jgi:hypothetical protein